MEITKTVIEEYKLKEEKPLTCFRVATITFKDGIFSHCNYKTNKSIYSRDDWKFLGKIEEKIKEIQENKETEEVSVKEIKENKKKMTFDDVIRPKGIKPLGFITLTPEMLRITLNELVKK